MSTLADDLASRMMSAGQTLISNLSPWYYNGAFYTNTMGNWNRNTFSTIGLMATLVKFGSPLSSTYIQMIREIVNRAIDTSLGSYTAYAAGSNPLGGYMRSTPDVALIPLWDMYHLGPDRNSMSGDPDVTFGVDDISVLESCECLAWALWQLPAGTITDAERAAWTKLCQDMCDFLDSTPNGITTYWVNGNINAQLCRAYWTTSMISAPGTVRDKYRDMYERALLFLFSPITSNPTRWANYGWKTTVTGNEYDWSNYEGYFTETNGNPQGGLTPDFDWNYTTVQMDALAGIFVMNRDMRCLRAINAMSVKIFPRWNTTTWVFNGTGGSRQNNNQASTWAWHHVQALIGIKSSNTTYLTPAKILDSWDHPTGGEGGALQSLMSNSTNGFYPPGFFQTWTVTIATVREACYQARLKVAAS